MPSLKRLSRSYKSAKPSKSSKPTKTDESVDNVQLPSDHHNNASASNAKSSTKGTKAAETDGKALTDNKAASKMKNSATEKQSPTNTTADLAVTTNKRTSRDTKATKHRRDRMDERKQRSSSAPSSLAAEQHSVTEQFDHVFVFGDTNYRINAERGFVLNAIHKQDFETLLKYDQLTLERHRCNTPLAAFKEHPIHFIPTYKLDTFEPTTTTNSASSLPSTPPSATTKTTSSSSSLVITPTDSIHSSGTCSVRYDTSPKQRIPSWTDRILWHDRPPDHVEAAASIHRHTTTDSHPHSKSKLCLQWISALTRKNRNNILVNTETVDKSTVCYHYDTVMDPRLVSLGKLAEREGLSIFLFVRNHRWGPVIIYLSLESLVFGSMIGQYAKGRNLSTPPRLRPGKSGYLHSALEIVRPSSTVLGGIFSKVINESCDFCISDEGTPE